MQEEYKKKYLIILRRGAAILGGIFLIYFFFFRTKNSFEKVMKETAAEMNKTCPLMADNDMRLDSSVVLPNKVFQYNYTLMNFHRDSMDIDLLKAGFEQAMLNNATTNADLEVFRENRVTLNYYFKDEAGNFVTKISVTPEMYLQDL